MKRGYPESSIWYEDPEVGGWGRSGSRRGRGELPKGPGGPVAVSPFSRRWKVKRGYPESVRSRRGRGDELPKGPRGPVAVSLLFPETSRRFPNGCASNSLQWEMRIPGRAHQTLFSGKCAFRGSGGASNSLQWEMRLLQ